MSSGSSFVHIALLLSVASCSPIPRALQKQVAPSGLMTFRIHGLPRLGDGISSGEFQLIASGAKRCQDCGQAFTAWLTHDGLRSQWDCDFGPRHGVCQNYGRRSYLRIVHGGDSGPPGNALRLVTSEAIYEYVTHTPPMETPEIIGIWRIAVAQEPDPETGVSHRGIMPRTLVGFVVRELDSMRLLLPVGREFEELRPLAVLSLGPVNRAGGCMVPIDLVESPPWGIRGLNQ